MTNEERVLKLNEKRQKYVDDVKYYTDLLAEAENKLQIFDDLAKDLMDVVIDDPVEIATTEDPAEETNETPLY